MEHIVLAYAKRQTTRFFSKKPPGELRALANFIPSGTVPVKLRCTSKSPHGGDPVNKLAKGGVYDGLLFDQSVSFQKPRR